MKQLDLFKGSKFTIHMALKAFSDYLGLRAQWYLSPEFCEDDHKLREHKCKQRWVHYSAMSGVDKTELVMQAMDNGHLLETDHKLMVKLLENRICFLSII